MEEFFQLFKTPWELYRPGRVYDVLVVTAGEIPDAKPRLLLVYNAAATGVDSQLGVSVRERRQGATLSHRDTVLPIYGELLTYADGAKGVPCVRTSSGIAGVTVEVPGATVIRLGYDLFEEVRLLLSAGQPVEQAHVPTLDIHIRMLRGWILGAGLPLLEIPPTPAGHDFSVCLTHDIDFIGIQNHKFDHSMWGFVYRATVGAVRNLFRGRISGSQFLKSWRAVASLPFVFVGWAKDFWEPFEWYLEVEKGLPATYFLIPFKRRSGEYVPGSGASFRATAYDINDLPQWTPVLQDQGCELGVHGIDAWHSVGKGRDEMARCTAATGKSGTGIRMHWLLRDANTPSVLEQAGYAYDSTVGYNETVGYRAGTAQVFRPLGVQTLLELPLHIQDGAMFYPKRLDLSEPEAEKRCGTLIDNATRLGGVLTVLWHDRSHGPERFWGDFYIKLLQTLRSRNPWFGSAAQVVGWFRKRRAVRFERVEGRGVAPTQLRYDGEQIHPLLKIRVYAPQRLDHRDSLGADAEFSDISWNGVSAEELEGQIAKLTPTLPDLALSSFS